MKDGHPQEPGRRLNRLRGRGKAAAGAVGSAYGAPEDEIIASLPKRGRQIFTPYTCTLYDIRADGTAATDIEHIVALAEANESGLARSRYREFGGDILNLTIAAPTVNRNQKSDKDAAEWRPQYNRGWYAARIVAVKQKYGDVRGRGRARRPDGNAQGKTRAAM